jgi:hypothetical protein
MTRGRESDLQEYSHVVNEGAGPSCAGAVHPLLQGLAEVRDLRILAAQLDRNVRLRRITLNSCSARYNLLPTTVTVTVTRMMMGCDVMVMRT